MVARSWPSTTGRPAAAARSRTRPARWPRPLAAVERPDTRRGLAALVRLVERADVERVVVGLPLTLARGGGRAGRGGACVCRAAGAETERSGGAVRRAPHHAARRAHRGARGRSTRAPPRTCSRATSPAPSRARASERRTAAGAGRPLARGARGRTPRARGAPGAAAAPTPPPEPPPAPSATGSPRPQRAATGADGRAAGAGRPPRRRPRWGRLRGRCWWPWSRWRVVVAWFADLALPAVQGRRRRAGAASTVPRGSSLEQIADLLESEGVVSSSRSSSCARGSRAAAASSSPAATRSREDMSFIAALDALEQGAAAEHRPGHDPRGALAPRDRADASGRLRGQLRRRHPPLARARSRATTGPRGPTSLEGFLFPATYELKRGSRCASWWTPARRLQAQASRTVDLRYARSKNLTALRRADHRLDGRARGRRCRGSGR